VRVVLPAPWMPVIPRKKGGTELGGLLAQWSWSRGSRKDMISRILSWVETVAASIIRLGPPPPPRYFPAVGNWADVGSTTASRELQIRRDVIP